MRTRREGAPVSKLHAQMSMFGAIDQEVSKAKKRLARLVENPNSDQDKAVVDLVNTFLPGTAGFGQDGWYEELTRFLNRDEIVKSPVGFDFPSLPVALNELRKSYVEEDERDPVLARAIFAAVILKKIYDLTHRGCTEDNDVLGILGPALRSWTVGNSNELAARIVDKIADINNRKMWIEYVGSIVNEEFADRSLPCVGTLKKVDDQYCAFITTDTTDAELTVSDVAKIIDPINWSKCCSFFCEMNRQNPPFDDSGAARLYERISGQCADYHIDTALVFWKAKQSDGSILINYDLDALRDNDSLVAEVDSGYLWITPAPRSARTTGVRIRTGKLERIKGLSPTATAALAQLLGWGDYAHEMLAGSGRRAMQSAATASEFTPLRLSPFDAQSYDEHSATERN